MFILFFEIFIRHSCFASLSKPDTFIRQIQQLPSPPNPEAGANTAEAGANTDTGENIQFLSERVLVYFTHTFKYVTFLHS